MAVYGSGPTQFSLLPAAASDFRGPSCTKTKVLHLKMFDVRENYRPLLKGCITVSMLLWYNNVYVSVRACARACSS